MKPSIAIFSFLLAAACSGSSDVNQDCSEGKCDTPGGTPEEQCKNARVPAMDEARPHFTDKGVRWSCRDVNGVTPNNNTSDDRGQEYCEYFSMLHTKGIPSIIAGAPFCDSTTACEEGVC